jgi:hypothetical protein
MEENGDSHEALDIGLRPGGQMLGDISGNRMVSAISEADTDKDIFQEIAEDGLEIGSDDVALLHRTDQKSGKSCKASRPAMAKSTESKIPRQVHLSRVGILIVTVRY